MKQLLRFVSTKQGTATRGSDAVNGRMPTHRLCACARGTAAGLGTLVVALVAFGGVSIAEASAGPCGIPDDYLDVRGILVYSIGEPADKQGTSLTDLGPVLVRATLSTTCDSESLNETNSCLHIERTSASLDDANATFERAVHDYPNKIVSLGWAISNEPGPGRVPIVAGMLFVPGYPVYRFSASQESCDVARNVRAPNTRVLRRHPDINRGQSSRIQTFR